MMSKSMILQALPTLFILTALIAELPMSTPQTVFAAMLSLLRAFKKGAVEKSVVPDSAGVVKKNTLICAGSANYISSTDKRQAPKTLHKVPKTPLQTI